MSYLSIRQTAEKWGVSTRWVNDLCADGRIPGATKIGSYWAIPDDAQKPRDARVKSGRYIKDTKGKPEAAYPIIMLKLFYNSRHYSQ